MADANWVPIGEVDYGKEVAEGVIELSKDHAAAAGDHKVLAVRCQSDNPAEPAPDSQLKVKIAPRLAPVVSNAGWGGLRVVEYGADIEARKLTLWETTKRIAARLALPAIVLVAALAALTGVLFSDLKDAMDIVTAGLTIPATIVAVCKAIKET
jgi:hypothetical protein